MITIKEIAEEVGVSATTVSNVLHGRTKKVSPEMVKKIQEILEEKNYVPRFGLNALTNRKSNMIGVLISTPEFVERSPYERPFYGTVIGTLESAFREKGYYIMLCSSKNMQEVMRMILGWNVDGVVSISLPPQYYQEIKKLTGKPVVSIDMDVDGSHVEGCYNITSTDEICGEEMMRYLLRQGIHKIIYVSNSKTGADYRRYKGVVKAYREKQEEEVHLESVMLGMTREERMETYQRLAEYAGQHAAIFFSADFNAAEAIGYFKRQHIRIPEDISVVGCDDDVFARLSVPGLTTIRVDNVKKAEIAAQIMLELLDGKQLEEKEIEIETCLIERDSVYLNGKEQKNAENQH
ncbi:LacI family DNA-binding transcriptional regulator [Faecalicatena contorta]|uniref:LacI family DNA-binding transcriptional regulator n=1 Tax=Faecalicatena contorta TaxID=39482 RepID=UPI001F194F41|nr:LacI family DNA-binding transcriptional regulator [Faecalicatena contorta]MCF2684084.1 LacI family DNA-binding transcriptional regulator [Faecalicatena contorta]